jgi:hypothetical protein
MTYNLNHLGSLPVVKNLPAYVDDAVTYLHAVVSIAANAAVRSSSGKINVWCEEDEKWLSLDKAELPEKVAAILALMAEE